MTEYISAQEMPFDWQMISGCSANAQQHWLLNNKDGVQDEASQLLPATHISTQMQSVICWSLVLFGQLNILLTSTLWMQLSTQWAVATPSREDYRFPRQDWWLSSMCLWRQIESLKAELLTLAVCTWHYFLVNFDFKSAKLFTLLILGKWNTQWSVTIMVKIDAK